MVAVTNPGFLGGGGAGGPAGAGFAAGGGAAAAEGLFSSAIASPDALRADYCSTSPPIMLMLSKVGMRSASSASLVMMGSAASMGQPGARSPTL